MANSKIKRALISVYDKTGIVEFAKSLVDEFGIEIISTGGTARLLKENGIAVTLVEDITGFPEMLDGRVKTLHPKIHAAILADRDNSEHMRQLEEQGIKPIDLVVVNLYPFEKTVADPSCTLEQAIEMIDIGGPCLLRAAAKNHRHVIPITTLDLDAESVLDALRGSSGSAINEQRLDWAARAFFATHLYDIVVHKWLEEHLDLDAEFDEMEVIRLAWPNIARYGENPHQAGALYEQLSVEESYESSITNASTPGLQSQDSVLSFNNCVDGQAALELCKELNLGIQQERNCTFIKHTNACGVGIADDPIEAYRRAYLGDANAAMGGILAGNFEVTHDFAEAVMDTYQRWGKEAGAGGFFVEVWIAPKFADGTVDLIRTAKNWGQRVRLLEVGDMAAAPDPAAMEYRSITGGMLVQTRDLVGLKEDDWKVATKRTPTDQELNDLRLAWLVCKHTKSNAISICKGGMLIGNGAGQMSRVMSCRISTWLAKENGHAEQLQGAAAASDAFFPFPDGPNILMDAGVTAIIQPGGSKRDQDTIDACNERNVAMILTGTRHFKH